jgi:hypothetical protein
MKVFKSLKLTVVGCLWIALLSHQQQHATVQAWGADGHEIVANLAWQLLDNATRTTLESILAVGTDGISPHCLTCSPLALVADWADAVRYRHDMHWTGALHYVDIRDDLVACPVTTATNKSSTCLYNRTRDCPNDACAAGAIVNYTNYLVRQHYTVKSTTAATRTNDGRSDDQALRQSLMFVVHIVGDIHQPLHVSRTSDRGGNSIEVHFEFERPNNLRSNSHTKLRWQRHDSVGRHSAENLHSIWDSVMIEKSIAEDYGGLRSNMDDNLLTGIHDASSEQWSEWIKCADGTSQDCVGAWAEESLEYALAWAYANVNGTEITSGMKLSHDYYTTRMDIVKRRLQAAGVRLAATLAIAMTGQKLLHAPGLSMNVAAVE